MKAVAASAAADAALAAALFAVDPQGLGGVVLRTRAGPARDDWLALLRRLLPPATPWRRVPLHINDTALLGGLDLPATLQAGRPVARQGLLAQADGGVVLLAMAERIEPGTAARLAAVLDTQAVRLERDGVALSRPARLGVVALDEGIEDDEHLCASLSDRLALRPTLAHAPAEDAQTVDWQPADIEAARRLLPQVSASDAVLQALCGAAEALGVDSLRGPLLALRTARAAAALAGDSDVQTEHAALAARLVLAPRATRLPQATEPDDAPAPDTPAPNTDPDTEPDTEPAEKPDDLPEERPDHTPPDTPDDHPEADAEVDPTQADALAGQVLESARAAIPAGLLAALQAAELQRGRSQAAGRAGALQKSQTHGRPVGVRRAAPQGGARINVIETLRAAAPWQRVRARQALLLAEVRLRSRVSASGPTARPRRVHVQHDDFHVTRFRQRGQTTTVFVVDASGSSALHRLAEAKGAVELLLADCYVRRDRVCVLAFRGASAELLLPPTRSLARAKRSLAGLPGGGGTPLASALDAAGALAEQILRRGETPVVVLLTDGRANIARDGLPGRARAMADAADAARKLRQAGLTALLLDTSPQPQESAHQLAREMGARYVPLPYAGAQALSQVVRSVTT